MDIKPSHDLKPGRYALCRNGRLWTISRVSLNQAVAIVRVKARKAATPVPATPPAALPVLASMDVPVSQPVELVRTVQAMREKALPRYEPKPRPLKTCRTCGELGPLPVCEYCRAYGEATS